MELGSSHDLLVWLVDVWESGGDRAKKLARGDNLVQLAVDEGKIAPGPPGLMDDFCQWFEDLRAGRWITYDDTEAVRVRFEGNPCSRNDVILGRNFVVTADGANWAKSSLTASSVGQVAVDLGALIRQLERQVEESDAPQETKEEARRWLGNASQATLSSAAGELLVRLVMGLHL